MVANEVFSSLENAAWGRRNDDDSVKTNEYTTSTCITRVSCFYDTLALQYNSAQAAGATQTSYTLDP